MKLKQIKLLVSSLILVFASLPAFAGDAPDSTFPKPQQVAGTYRPTVGLLGGYAEQNGPIHPAINYGAEFAFQPIVPIGLGIEFTHFRAGADVPSGIDYSFYRNSLLAKVTYNLGGEMAVIRNTYIGLKFGAVFDKEDINIGGTESDTSRTRFAFAPVLGMDFMFAQGWSIGPQFSYLFTVGPETAYNTFEAMAALKYWF